MTLLLYTQMGVSVLLCGFAAWRDFRTGHIPNWLSVPCLAIGLGIGFAASGYRGLITACVGALVTALVPMLLFRMRAMGGGDVKLFAALGAVDVSFTEAVVGASIATLFFIASLFRISKQ